MSNVFAIHRIASAWKASKPLPVSEWAERHRYLSDRESAEPGMWRNDRAPYLTEIMDAMGDPDIDEVVIVKPSQGGGSEAVRNALAAWIDQDPGPCLIVFPDQKSAEETIEERVRVMLDETPRLRKYLPASAYDLKKRLLSLRSMDVYVGWAGSPQTLATRPCRYLIFDECDKYPTWSKTDAGPIKLGEKRTRTYQYRKKIVKLSTPTVAENHISKQAESCSEKRYYELECIHCGERQKPVWGQVKWPDRPDNVSREKHAERIEEEGLAHYVCNHCGVCITEEERMECVRRGGWRVEGEGRKVAFYFNALVNPWTTMSKMAAEFVQAQGDLPALMAFINNELGEPFEEQAGRVDGGILHEKRECGYPSRTVPAYAGMLIATADTQKGHYKWLIRAWGRDYRSRLVDWGEASTLEELRNRTLGRAYPTEDGRPPMSVSFCYIDARGGTGASLDETSQTEKVYRYCMRTPRMKPLTGWSGRSVPEWRYKQKWHKYQPQEATRASMRVKRTVVNTQLVKNDLHARIHDDDGSIWEVHEEIGSDYISQMQSEHRVAVRRSGTVRYEWKIRTKGMKNEAWDLEVYQLAVAYAHNLDLLPSDPRKSQASQATGYKAKKSGKGDWKIGR